MDPMLAAILQSSDPSALLQDRRPAWAQGQERVGGFQSVNDPELGARRFAAPTPEDARANVRGTVQDTVLDPAKTYAKAFMQTLGKAFVGKSEERLDTEADVRKKSYDVGEGFFNPVSGMVGMLAGKGAVGAPLDKLAAAMKAELKGTPSQEIWRKYGWEKGKDGQWRWEISDDAARLSPKAQESLYAGTPIDRLPLGQVYEHPELYKAYPQLAEIPTNMAKGGRGGSFMPTVAEGGGEINAIARDPEMMLRVLTHEGQHGVQEIEKFAVGGSPSTVSPGEVALARSRPLSVEDLKDPAKTAYMRRAGEVEARNAEARLADSDLRKMAPGLTEDVPRMLQTVRFMQETSPQLAVKEKGGMWHPEAVERLSQSLTKHLDEIERRAVAASEQAIIHGDEAQLNKLEEKVRASQSERSLYQRMIKNYLNKYAGTKEDPLANIEVPYLDGTAKWEELTDTTIASRTALKYHPNDPIGKGITEGRIPATDEVWDFDKNSSALGPLRNPAQARAGFPEGAERMHSRQASEAIESYLSHVGDYLRQNVDPAKLQQYDLVRAVKETAANDARVAKEMEKASAASTKDLPVYKDYTKDNPGTLPGMKWVELKLPEKLTEEQAKGVRSASIADKANLGNPGDTAAYINEKYRDSYVAVDPQGKPIQNSYTNESAVGKTPQEAHLAGQLAQEGNQMGHCVGGYCEGVASGESRIFSLRDPKGRSHVTVEVAPGADPKPSFEDGAWVPGERGENILQIKGKQNRAPVAEYLPYVQDFVKSGKWGEVGDLGNTGLRRNRKTGEYRTDTELLKDPNFRYNHEWD